MDPALAHAVRTGHGLVTYAAVAGHVPRWALDNACRSGALRRVLPGVYVDAARIGDPRMRLRAALAYVGPSGALSHTTALQQWGLHRAAADAPIHVAVPATSALRSRGGLTVHRSRDPPGSLARHGWRITPLDRTLVESWPLLAPAERCEPVLRAVGGRLTTPARIGTALTGAPRLAARGELRDLLDRLAAGCRSALEIWGHDRVFTGPGMPAFRRQFPVRLGGRTVYLDVYAQPEQVAFELDGAAFHGDPVQREADLRRDAALAGVGIHVVRFSHRRLVGEPAAVREEVLAILRAARL